MKFYNRKNEILRLTKAIESLKSKLIVVYGRRRCGKSTLIKQVLDKNDIYFMAQQSDESVLLSQMARIISEKIPGFDKLIYPDWDSLLTNLDNTIHDRFTLCIDEFPYLVKSSLDVPSIIQKFLDQKKDRKFHIILCGSSQQMMQGLVLHSSAPLYGRADEILKLQPLKAGWIQEALQCNAVQAVEEYSVWGGIPRYWELRREETSFDSAIENLILDRSGVLHEEPARLFLDDMRESIQAYSILSIVGNGVNRLSEIAGRLRKPATHLARPIDNLIKLGYLKREVPYGSSPKSNKKSLYRISDPYMNFYFSFVTANLSRLELDMQDAVFKSIRSLFAQYFAAEWENLCRLCIPFKSINGIEFDVCNRWWGKNTKGEPMELDVVSKSMDKKYILVGECKWSKVRNPDPLLNELKNKASYLPGQKGKKIIPILFVKAFDDGADQSGLVFTPSDVMERLK